MKPEDFPTEIEVAMTAYFPIAAVAALSIDQITSYTSYLVLCRNVVNASKLSNDPIERDDLLSMEEMLPIKHRIRPASLAVLVENDRGIGYSMLANGLVIQYCSILDLAVKDIVTYLLDRLDWDGVRSVIDATQSRVSLSDFTRKDRQLSDLFWNSLENCSSRDSKNQKVVKPYSFIRQLDYVGVSLDLTGREHWCESISKLYDVRHAIAHRSKASLQRVAQSTGRGQDEFTGLVNISLADTIAHAEACCKLLDNICLSSYVYIINRFCKNDNFDRDIDNMLAIFQQFSETKTTLCRSMHHSGLFSMAGRGS